MHSPPTHTSGFFSGFLLHLGRCGHGFFVRVDAPHAQIFRPDAAAAAAACS